MTDVSAPIREDEPATRRKDLPAMPARILPGRLLRLARSLILVPWLLPLLVTGIPAGAVPAGLGRGQLADHRARHRRGDARVCASRPVARRRIAVVVSALLAALVLTASGCTGHPAAPDASDPTVRQAQVVVARALQTTGDYRGPQRGPPAQRPGLIVFVAADLTNGGIAGVAQGAEQAAGAIGWPLRILDGQASV